MNANLKRRLAALYNPEEVAKIEVFLGREGGFSPAGEIALVLFMLEAQGYDITVQDILHGCELEWGHNWHFQQPDIRGSPAVSGAIGIQNRASIEMFYLHFRIPSPLIVENIQIPDSSFMVRTRQSVYHFGDVKLNGTRTIIRGPVALTFERCVVERLAYGKPMQVFCPGDSPHRWWTTPVLEVN